MSGWKIRIAIIQWLVIRSLQTFAHATMVQLSCHVQNFPFITLSECGYVDKSKTKFLSNVNWNPHWHGPRKFISPMIFPPKFKFERNLFSLTPIQDIISLQTFVHATTVRSSCHVQNSIGITLLQNLPSAVGIQKIESSLCMSASSAKGGLCLMT